MTLRVNLLKVFPTNSHGGNGAGVVINTPNLTDTEQQDIAREVGFSETAFVEDSKIADFKVRFFTPKGEVDMCGHATIAVYSFLFQKGLIKAGYYTQEINIGILGIIIHDNGFIEMEQAKPIFSEYITAEKINRCLNIPIVFTDLKAQIVSTGLRDILLPIPDRETLDSLIIDPIALSALNTETNTIGLHAFTLDTLDSKAIAYCRNFAPLYDISEESATGSANAALACYLFTQGKFNGKSTDKMKFEQGYVMNEPSEIFVTLNTTGQSINKVHIGGTATIIGEKELK